MEILALALFILLFFGVPGVKLVLLARSTSRIEHWSIATVFAGAAIVIPLRFIGSNEVGVGASTAQTLNGIGRYLSRTLRQKFQ